ncbi:MAG: hypothetical protein H0U75_00080 [Legionella sp.]|nr:hypothetical protein [Legionella sp.]
MKKLPIVLTGALLALSFSMSSCNQGPAEKKGKKIDNAVQSMQDKIQNKGPAQKAGEKLDDVVNN